MYCRTLAFGLILIACGILNSCDKPTVIWRTAVLRFENLTPSPDSDWLGRAISEEISGQLEGTRHNAVILFSTLRQLDGALGPRPVQAPGVSAERAAAIGAGANRIVTGYFTVNGNRLSITAKEENLETRREAPPIVVAGAVEEVLHLTDQIARAIDEEALPPITGSARAMRSYALALESPAAQAGLLQNEANRLDPDFGKPYVALAQTALSAKDGVEFEKVFAAARARGNGIDAVDRAILNLDQARLHADLPTRIDALGALVRLLPADPFRLQELGTAELDANRYAEAADHFRKLGTLLPTNTEWLNLLGYAQMYGGDEAGAFKTFETFRRSNPKDANALDSTGDAYFFFNHFDQAENWYRQAHDRNAEVAGSAELLKMAWARLMRGDRAGARELTGRYRNERAKLHDPWETLRAAQVIRVAGAPAEAESMLAEYPAWAPLGIRQTAAAQLAWWRYLDGTGPAPEQLSPNAQALITMAGKNFAAAVPIWRKLAENTAPSEWWTRAVYARALAVNGQTQESGRYLKFTPPPQPGRILNFDELWYPWILEARHQASGKVA